MFGFAVAFYATLYGSVVSCSYKLDCDIRLVQLQLLHSKTLRSKNLLINQLNEVVIAPYFTLQMWLSLDELSFDLILVFKSYN